MFVKKTVRLSCIMRVRQHPPRSKSRFGGLITGPHAHDGFTFVPTGDHLGDSHNFPMLTSYVEMRVNFLRRVRMGTSTLGEAISVRNSKTLPVLVNKYRGLILIWCSDHVGAIFAFISPLAGP